jgi:hypothetical protein
MHTKQEVKSLHISFSPVFVTSFSLHFTFYQILHKLFSTLYAVPNLMVEYINKGFYHELTSNCCPPHSELQNFRTSIKPLGSHSVY